MTNEHKALVDRLRKKPDGIAWEAARVIEDLAAEVGFWKHATEVGAHVVKQERARAEAAEAKLVESVEVIRKLAIAGLEKSLSASTRSLIARAAKPKDTP